MTLFLRILIILWLLPGFIFDALCGICFISSGNNGIGNQWGETLFGALHFREIIFIILLGCFVGCMVVLPPLYGYLLITDYKTDKPIGEHIDKIK